MVQKTDQNIDLLEEVVYKMKWFYKLDYSFCYILHDSCYASDTGSFLAYIWCIKHMHWVVRAANNWHFLCSAALLCCFCCLSQSIHTNHEPWAVWCACKFGGQCNVRNMSLVVSHPLHKTNTRKCDPQRISHVSSWFCAVSAGQDPNGPWRWRVI